MNENNVGQVKVMMDEVDRKDENMMENTSHSCCTSSSKFDGKENEQFKNIYAFHFCPAITVFLLETFCFLKVLCKVNKT